MMATVWGLVWDFLCSSLLIESLVIKALTRYSSCKSCLGAMLAVVTYCSTLLRYESLFRIGVSLFTSRVSGKLMA